MGNINLRAFYFIWAALLFQTSQGRTIRVPADSPTIQAAVNVAVANDTVSVAPGIYNEVVILRGRPITLLGEGTKFEAIIQPPAGFAAISAISNETSSARITGFSIRNAVVGINVVKASPTIYGNLISSCASGVVLDTSNASCSTNRIVGCTEAGVKVTAGAPTVRMNTIEICGNGILSASGEPTIRENIIRRNTAAAISLTGQSDARVYQNVIYGNGGAAVVWNIFNAPKGPRLIQNTIVASTNAAFVAAGFDTTCVVANNIFVGTPAVNLQAVGDNDPPTLSYNQLYSLSGPAITGLAPQVATNSGNFLAQPKFLAPAYDDYQILPDSPGIDRGLDFQVGSTDFLGNARLVDGDGNGSATIDIGAYEYFTGQARPPTASFSAIVYADYVDFSWAPTDGATTYYIKRATSPAGPFIFDLISTNGLSARDTTVVSNTIYYYVISGANANGRGADSPPLRVIAGELGPVTDHILRVPLDQSSIQSAIDLALPGDTVLVGPGVYHELISLRGKPITVRGTGPNFSSILEPPVGMSDRAVLTANSSETAASILTGFTIRNSYVGANIQNASPGIVANIITNCVSGLTIAGGGGIYSSNQIVACSDAGANINGGTATLSGNLIERCGVGLVSGAGALLIRDNIVRSNLLFGISLIEASDAKVIQNVIYGAGNPIAWNIKNAPIGPVLIQNTIVSSPGNSHAAFTADGFDTTCVVANNILVGTPAVELASHATTDTQPPVLTNNLLFAASGPAVIGLTPQIATNNGNFIANPQFLAQAYGDFQLLSSSPAIDRAAAARVATTVDLLGALRAVDGDGNGSALADLGAYEFTPGPARPPTYSFAAGSFPDFVQFDWISTDGATNYFIKRSTNPGGPFEEIISTGDLSARDTTAVRDTVYFYTIAGENSLGRGPDSPPLSIKAGNHAPVAVSDTIDVLEDTPIEFDVTANDLEEDHDPLILRLLAPLPNGLSLLSSNYVRFLPPTNVSLVKFTFAYEISDQRGGYSTGYVSMRIQPVNDPPSAEFQTSVALANMPTPILLNVIDPDSTKFTVIVVTPPAHGLLSTDGTNVIYRPAHGYYGLDNFSAVVSDGSATSAVASCSLTVLRPPDIDNDGMPDDFEILWDLANTFTDPDHDGLSNLFEYLADTSPRDPASLVKIADIRLGDDGRPILRWLAVGGVRYRLWSSDELSGDISRASFRSIVLDAAHEIEPAPYGQVVTRELTDPQAPASGSRRFYFLEVVR